MTHLLSSPAKAAWKQRGCSGERWVWNPSAVKWWVEERHQWLLGHVMLLDGQTLQELPCLCDSSVASGQSRAFVVKDYVNENGPFPLQIWVKLKIRLKIRLSLGFLDVKIKIWMTSNPSALVIHLFRSSFICVFLLFAPTVRGDFLRFLLASRKGRSHSAHAVPGAWGDGREPQSLGLSSMTVWTLALFSLFHLCGISGLESPLVCIF